MKDVCQDLATFKQSSGSCYVSDDGAFTAEDEIRQVNGRGTVRIKNLFGKDYGKVIRSCGNCSGNGEARNVVIENSVAVDSDVLCGVNRNYGDTCQISKTCQDGCNRDEGNSSGKEPKKIGSGPDGTCCTVSGASKNC